MRSLRIDCRMSAWNSEGLVSVGSYSHYYCDYSYYSYLVELLQNCQVNRNLSFFLVQISLRKMVLEVSVENILSVSRDLGDPNELCSPKSFTHRAG